MHKSEKLETKLRYGKSGVEVGQWGYVITFLHTIKNIKSNKPCNLSFELD